MMGFTSSLIQDLNETIPTNVTQRLLADSVSAKQRKLLIII